MSCILLYIITDLNLGGVPLHLRRLAKAIRDRFNFDLAAANATSPHTPGSFRPTPGSMRHANHAVAAPQSCIEVVSLAHPGPVGEMLRAEGFTIHSCNACCGWDPRVIPRLAGIIRQTRPRLIHSFLFHANLAAKLAAPLAGFPSQRIVCEIQTVEVERKWHLAVDRLTKDLCALTIGNSPSVIEHLHHRAGIPRDRLRLVRGGVDVDAIDAARPVDRPALGFPAESRLILWVGRLDPIKGLEHLIDAMSLLAAHPNPDVSRAKLALVGEGRLRARLQAKVDSLRLSNSVQFLGPRSDVPCLLKTCDVFVFPSRTEGFPNALLEAMAAGCPIVTTDVPGCRDLIRNLAQGLVVPYGDVPALADAIAKLLLDRSLALRLGRTARESARENWSQSQTWVQYEAIYHELLSVRG